MIHFRFLGKNYKTRKGTIAHFMIHWGCPFVAGMGTIAGLYIAVLLMIKYFA
jgi:hypothetical protein